MAHQPQPQQPRGGAPPAPLPVQARRRIVTDKDVDKAYAVVKKEFTPVREGVPEVMVFNDSNRLGNKRREIYRYLPAPRRYEGLLTKLSNDLQGLECKLRQKLIDYNTFMPGNPLEMPGHFTRYPELMSSAPKKSSRK